MKDTYDVVVVGGGAAGLSGALALVRSRRSVLVIDSGEPRNTPAAHVHNYLTRDGEPPAALYARGREEVTGYGGEVVPGRVTALARTEEGFRVEFDGHGVDDDRVEARRLLVATGSRDKLPDVPGLAERWGLDVLHCPYCHGWEVRDQRVGVLAASPAAMHQALLFRQLTSDLSLLTLGGFLLAAEDREQLGAIGVAVHDVGVTAVESDARGLTGVRLADGRIVHLDAVVVGTRSMARAELLAPLGVRPTEVRMGDQVIGTVVEADPTGATEVPGLWVAGNIATVQAQVISSAAAGLAAGAAINAHLIAEDSRRALDAATSSTP